MAYVISGQDGSEEVSETRDRPASASLLAQKWLEDGFKNVRIVWNDRSFDVGTFRKTFILTPKGTKPRRAFPVPGEFAT